ncbi:hypothetical protein COLO4_37597 [Corchorus olitorius]|uniref:Uncharacterized protein n=1 Tax=Corchorus olitorius TaxID=93759 RepID=A0A1R3G0K7_9ROSI|nr:hypothetical protein COLO4_37597 [Corchorus olitorius]
MKQPKSYVPNRTNRSQQNRKKLSPNTSPPSGPTVGPKLPAKNLVMGPDLVSIPTQIRLTE